jgi:hypothetical protein
MAELETPVDGQRVSRDIDGKFARGGTLSSERAAELGRMKHTRENSVARDELLRDRGIDADNADAGLRSLAEIATSGRSGAVQALRYLDLLTGYGQPEAAQTEQHQVEVYGLPGKEPQIVLVNRLMYVRPTKELEEKIRELALENLRKSEREREG